MSDEPKDRQITRELHALEAEFGLSALDILDIINRRNRCKIAVRGAIAEAYLLRHLQQLRDSGLIEGFEDFDRDGQQDFRIDFDARSFLADCKNVQKPKSTRSAGEAPVTIDLWRTRNPRENPHLRYYHPAEFDIVAACLWNRTGRWEFRFAATADWPRHPN